MNHTPRNRTLLQVLVTAIVAVAMMAAFLAVGGMGSGVRGVIVFAQSTTMHSSTSTCSQDDNNQGDENEQGDDDCGTTASTGTTTTMSPSTTAIGTGGTKDPHSRTHKHSAHHTKGSKSRSAAGTAKAK